MPTIPNQDSQKWRGQFRGEFFGDIFDSYNIDLEKNEGKITTGQKSYAVSTSDDLASSGMGTPYRFLATNADGTKRWWAMCSAKMVKTSAYSHNSAYTNDAIAGTPTNNMNDMVVHESNAGEDRLFVSRNTTISVLNYPNHDNVWVPNWWGRRAITSSTNTAPIEITAASHGFESGDVVTVQGHATNTGANGTFTIVKVDANKFTMTGSSAVGGAGTGGTVGFASANQLDLTSGVFHPMEKIGRLVAVGDGLYVHTIDQNDVINAKRLTLPNGYEVNGIFAGSEDFWITSKNNYGGKGLIQRWDGFSTKVNEQYEIEGIPWGCSIVSNIPYIISDNGTISKYNGNGFSPLQYLPNYDDDIVLTDNASVHYSRICANDGETIYIALTAPIATSNRMKGGVWAFNTNTKNLTHIYSPNKYKITDTSDFGGTDPYLIGGLTYISKNIFLYGAFIYKSQDTSSLYTIQCTTGNSNRGYFVTPWIPSVNISDFWYNVWVKHSRLNNTDSKIVLKYRVTDQETTNSGTPNISVITWVNATTFTSVLPTGVAVGDEVEVYSGANSGCCFHISTLSGVPNDVATITVVLDEAAPITTTDKGKARYENWIKVSNNNPITSLTDLFSYHTLNDGETSSGPYVQLKVELRGFKVEISQIKIDSEPQVEAKL